MGSLRRLLSVTGPTAAETLLPILALTNQHYLAYNIITLLIIIIIIFISLLY